MTRFRNAYHFVPRLPNDGTAKGRTLPEKPRDFGLRPGHESEGHAIYADDAHSGRLICRITLECPTIIGGARQKGVSNSDPAKVVPFLVGGRPAIPATSLRGMLSLVAESAARAPYRVLKNMNLTVAELKSENGKRHVVRHKAIGGKAQAISSKDPNGRRTSSAIGLSHAYFDKSLLPMAIGANGIKRALVNPVESMFGFVAEADKDQPNAGRGKVNSAAGKLRISHACPSGAWDKREVASFYLAGDRAITIDRNSPVFGRLPKGVTLTLLKEQGQPMKTPERQDSHKDKAGFSDSDYEELNSATPNFYFFDKQTPDQFVSKASFATTDPSRFEPQGGKFYLHNPDAVPDTRTGQTKEPWKTRAAIRGKGVDRKAAAPVLKHGVTFDFHIDFDNLTDHELNLLCFALRPSERFRHKIGLGKALGLGSIRLDVTDLVLINRKARYGSEALFADDQRTVADGSGAPMAKARAAEHDVWLTEADPSARTALLAIGETHDFDGEGGQDAQTAVLWVPLTEERYADHLKQRVQAEDRSFEWFTKNDALGGPQQKLAPIGSRKIPVLYTEEPPAAPSSNSERVDRIGTLSWHGSGSYHFGRVTDDDTGEVFHVVSRVLKGAGLTAMHNGAKVLFASTNVVQTGEKFPTVYRISRLKTPT